MEGEAVPSRTRPTTLAPPTALRHFAGWTAAFFFAKMDQRLTEGVRMNLRHAFVATSLLVSIPLLTATGLEREALSIEALRLDVAAYKHSDDIGLAITDVTPVEGSGGTWAVASEIGAGRLSQSSGPSFDRLHLKLGVQRHLTSVTSVALLGGYAWYDGDDSFEIGSITLAARQLLTSPYAAVAPYVLLNGSLQFVDPSLSSPARTTESYRMSVVEALAGCEFRMQEKLAFVFEGGVSESESLDSDGNGFADGWLFRIAMQYDWF